MTSRWNTRSICSRRSVTPHRKCDIVEALLPHDSRAWLRAHTAIPDSQEVSIKWKFCLQCRRGSSPRPIPLETSQHTSLNPVLRSLLCLRLPDTQPTRIVVLTSVLTRLLVPERARTDSVLVFIDYEQYLINAHFIGMLQEAGGPKAAPWLLAHLIFIIIEFIASKKADQH